jgi:hypothetical protein
VAELERDHATNSTTLFDFENVDSEEGLTSDDDG